MNNCRKQDGLFSRDLWNHVTVWECLVATQTHDIWLTGRSECTNFIRQQNPKFLALSPVRTMFTKEFNQGLLIAKDEGVASAVLPTKVHGCGFQVAVPGICDVLTDIVQQDVHRESLGVIWMDQDIVGEQSIFLHPAQGR